MTKQQPGKSKKSQISSLSFEEGIQQLEKLVQSVESGKLPLEESISSYEKGMELVSHLRNLLGGAEQRLKLLKQTTSAEEAE